MTTPNSDSVPKSDLLVTQADMADVAKQDAIFLPENAFGGRMMYISSIHNRFFLADRRWNVTATRKNESDNSVVWTGPANGVFDGNYDTYLAVPDGQYLEISIKFDNLPGGFYGTYSYGDFILSFYHNYITENVSCKVFTNYQTPGWVELPKRNENRSGHGHEGKVVAFKCNTYRVEEIIFTIRRPTGAPSTQDVWVSEIEFYNNRPGFNETPVVSKFVDENLYRRLSWVDGNRAINAYIDEDGSSYFKSISSPSLDAKQDKPTSGTASSTTYLRGDGTWATPTNTTYSVMSEAEATAGTATTARTTSAAGLKGAIQRWATGTYSTAISAIGQALNRAATAADARNAIGAGTSNLAIGTTSTTAKAGNWTPGISEVTGLQAALDGKEKVPWQGTQAQYDTLGTYESDRTYYITD